MRIFEVATDFDLTGIDMTSAETFVQSMSRIPRERVVVLNNEFVKRREQHDAQYSSLTKLYHGAPERSRVGDRYLDIHGEIVRDGFKLTKGRRTIGLGDYLVDNLGIFLSDSKSIAQFFGDNRDDHGRGRVIECRVDTRRLYDSSVAKGEIAAVGLSLINEYKGTTKTKLALRDWWWLVDQPELVNMVQQTGFTGILFKETTGVRRAANSFDGHTFFIFDPKSIHIETRYTIASFYEELKRDL